MQFNSWYPYFGEPTSDAMLALVPVAKRLGCEAFVVDAGWYRTDEGESAESWEARTGDWHTSRTRFPNGLREVSDGLSRSGHAFRPVVRAGGDRAICPRCAASIRNGCTISTAQPPAPDARAVLNLGIPAARRHVFERVTRILSTVGRRLDEVGLQRRSGCGRLGAGTAGALTDQDPLVAHYEGLYRLQDAIRRWFPDLILEMCASGGGRMDGAILSHAHVNWISDQPGALRKLAIHFGSQLAHPAVVCNDWLVEWPPGSIAATTRRMPARWTNAATCRSACVSRCSAASASARGRISGPTQISRSPAAHVALYRDTVRAIVHHGDQYLLTQPPAADGSGDWAAIWYVAKDGCAACCSRSGWGVTIRRAVFRVAGAAGGRAVSGAAVRWRSAAS